MARFDQFTDAEQMLISEALNALLPIKISALVTVNDHLASVKGGRPFDGADFGIPQIRALLTELYADDPEESTVPTVDSMEAVSARFAARDAQRT